MAGGDVTAVRSAASMLTELEQVWRRWSTTTSSPAVPPADPVARLRER
ncbi:hypothetical protein [Micromonospora sp. NPDC047730]